MFTNEEILKALDTVVEGKEDYVYEAVCNTDHKRDIGIGYSYDDCIVGCVIRELDADLHAQILETERAKGTSLSFDLISASAHGIRMPFSSAQITALRSGQVYQDVRHPWGVAAAAIREELGA